MAERTPRAQTTREGGERKKGWQRQSLLPTPEPRDGLKFRWVRTSTMGKEDNPNVSSRFREGYVPVLAADFPELRVLPDHNSRFPENLEVGGLILCSIPAEFAEERVEGQLQQAKAQMDAVDRNYMRENDPRMPLLASERSTRTTFGKE
ncbi:MAG: hypothetical protein QM805_07630 [Pseudomonas sp.]